MTTTPGGPTLLIVSHTPHHRVDGRVVGFEPTVVEIDHLAALFGRVRHLAPLHEGDPPRGATPYRATNVEFVPLRPAGGSTLGAKLGIVIRFPGWTRALRAERRRADVTHIRAPANIALVALMLGGNGPTWIKYAGDWRTAGGPWSYRLQRRLARRSRPRTITTVNGRNDDDPSTVRSFDNPSLTADDLDAGRRTAADKDLGGRLRLVFAGRLERPKGAPTAVGAIADLVGVGHDAHLTMVGSGPASEACQRQAIDLGIDDRVTFTGSLPRAELLEHFAEAHFVVLPTTASEGWPKVLSEAMAFGAVPISGDVSSIAEVLDQIGCGTVAPPTAVGVAAAIAAYVDDPARWRRERDLGLTAADRFSFRTHLERVRALLGEIAPDIS